MTGAAPDAIGLDVFYPIVPDVDWLKRLVPLGVRTIQLRAKDMEAQQVRTQIAESLAVCADHDCQLIVNDYWQLAIEAGADVIITSQPFGHQLEYQVHHSSPRRTVCV